MTDDRALVDSLIAAITSINPLQEKFLASSLADIELSERDDLEAYLAFGIDQGLPMAYLAECYDLIVKDTLREQIYFQRHGRYRYSTFDEVADSVYFDDAYMRKYMHGLAITAYLWPNHRALHRFFLKTLPRQQLGAYLEVGPGHGMYMMSAMRYSGYGRFRGIDISPTSVAMTLSLIDSGRFGSFDNYSLVEKDFLESDIERGEYAAVVMGEVLEHVEAPERFLRRIYEISADDAYIFITTPINAPAIDHIYLFESYEAIESLVREARLRVRDRLLVPYPGLTVEESMQESLPINVALVLCK